MNFNKLSDSLNIVKREGAYSQYFENGFQIFEKLIPNDLIDIYIEKFERDCNTPDLGWTLKSDSNSGSYNTYCQAYKEVKELRDILLHDNLWSKLKDILESDPLLHLSLNGWKSTTRNWHQDSYLNPPFVLHNYIAVWIALEDIHPDSGPFQYCPKSNLGRVLTKDKVLKECNVQENPYWPWQTQDAVSLACEQEIIDRGYEIQTFLPKKGDVLFWHPFLIHRGSEPKDSSLLRRTIIAHYSSLRVRKDMNSNVINQNNKFYF